VKLLQQGLMKMAKMTRYSLYYRLMDIAFVASLITLISFAFKATTGIGLFGYVPFKASTVLVPLAVLLPSLLIFQRWMRDDFSEMLWQKSAGTVLKLLVVLPIPIIFIFVFVVAADGIAPPSSTDPLSDDPLLEGMLNGVVRSIVILWLITPMLFSLAFQWHRWRASR
jgi:SNF family Na+-dependent transporter